MGRNPVLKRIISIMCAGAITLLHSCFVPAGPSYFPEVNPEHLLELQTQGMSCNERLKWYLEKTSQPEDETIAAAQAEISPDVAAILNVGGEIQEYVAQTTDNDFYLTHNVYGGEDVNGAAFLDSRCSFFPQDDQIMIHGHNMKGGAVFGRLNNYRDISYLLNHPLITLETLAGTDYYVPYAITDVNVDMEAENYFLTIVWKFDPDSFETFTGSLIGKSYYDIPVDVQYSDRLLTLSTCSYVYSDSRLLICARKLREDETPEAMSALVSQSTLSGTEADESDPYTGGGDYEDLSGSDYDELLYETDQEITYLQNAAPDIFE